MIHPEKFLRQIKKSYFDDKKETFPVSDGIILTVYTKKRQKKGYFSNLQW